MKFVISIKNLVSLRPPAEAVVGALYLQNAYLKGHFAGT